MTESSTLYSLITQSRESCSGRWLPASGEFNNSCLRSGQICLEHVFRLFLPSIRRYLSRLKKPSQREASCECGQAFCFIVDIWERSCAVEHVNHELIVSSHHALILGIWPQISPVQAFDIILKTSLICGEIRVAELGDRRAAQDSRRIVSSIVRVIRQVDSICITGKRWHFAWRGGFKPRVLDLEIIFDVC